MTDDEPKAPGPRCWCGRADKVASCSACLAACSGTRGRKQPWRSENKAGFPSDKRLGSKGDNK